MFAEAASQLSTLRDWLRFAVSRFNEAGLSFGHGSTNAYDEAAYLLLHTLHLPIDRLEPFLDARLTKSEIEAVERLLARRIRERIPAAYLTREAWLGEFRFYVDERVIVPRSYIAELLRDRLYPWLSARSSPRAILDLCTGSGCLAIVAAHTFPGAQVDGIDLSRAALAVARRNVRGHHLSARIHLQQSDLFSKLGGKRYGLILTNPPYVRESVMRKLPAEFRQEPALALQGGRDGLDLVRRIFAAASAHLEPRGWLVMEVGHNRQRVERAFPRLPFIWAETSGGDDCTLLLPKEALPQWAMPALPSTPAVVRRPRRSVR